MLFEEPLKFEGNRDEVWKRVSAVREIPNYWHGTRSLEVVSEGQNAGCEANFLCKALCCHRTSSEHQL